MSEPVSSLDRSKREPGSARRLPALKHVLKLHFRILHFLVLPAVVVYVLLSPCACVPTPSVEKKDDYGMNMLNEGQVDAGHSEFFEDRVTIVEFVEGVSDHATHVAGTIGARGANPTARGMAPGVGIRSWDFWGDTTTEQAESMLAR